MPDQHCEFLPGPHARLLLLQCLHQSTIHAGDFRFNERAPLKGTIHRPSTAT